MQAVLNINCGPATMFTLTYSILFLTTAMNEDYLVIIMLMHVPPPWMTSIPSQ